MAAKSDGRLKRKKSGGGSDVAFTPLQNSEHSGSGQALAPGLGSGSAAEEGDEAPGGGGSGGGSSSCCCCRCSCCCSGSGGAGGAGGAAAAAAAAGGGGSAAALCLQLGRDQRRRRRRYSLWDGLWLLAAVAVYLADVGTDVWLAVDYYVRGQRWWFGLTLFFVVLGSLSVQAFSFRWFVHDFSTEDSAAAAGPGCTHQASSTGDSKTALGGTPVVAGEGDSRPGTPHRQPGAPKSSLAAATSCSGGIGAGTGGPPRAGGARRSATCSFCIWLLQSLIHLLQLGQIWR